MNEVLLIIDEIQDNIFEYDIKLAMFNISELIEKLVYITDKLDEVYIKDLNLIFNIMNTAINNKDYLLYSDILEFKLKPFMANVSL